VIPRRIITKARTSEPNFVENYKSDHNKNLFLLNIFSCCANLAYVIKNVRIDLKSLPLPGQNSIGRYFYLL